MLYFEQILDGTFVFTTESTQKHTPPIQKSSAGREMGFKNVSHVAGGFGAMLVSGFKVIK